MKEYLIRYDQKKIISVTVHEAGDLVGLHNKHEILPLTDAIVKFNNDGFDISLLVKEYNKPDIEEEEEITEI